MPVCNLQNRTYKKNPSLETNSWSETPNLLKVKKWHRFKVFINNFEHTQGDNLDNFEHAVAYRFPSQHLPTLFG